MDYRVQHTNEKGEEGNGEREGEGNVSSLLPRFNTLIQSIEFTTHNTLPYLLSLINTLLYTVQGPFK